MIETRNATNTMVLSRSGVNIWNVADLLLEKKSFKFLMNRFPINKEEIFAVIDVVAVAPGAAISGNVNDNVGTSGNVDVAWPALKYNSYKIGLKPLSNYFFFIKSVSQSLFQSKPFS